jgi:chromosome segregation ATPase
MQDQLKKTEDLIGKIRRLIEKHEKLQEAFAEATDEINALKKVVAEKDEKLERLERDANALRLGQFIELSDQEKKEVRQKINDYLKELDRIIEKISGEG